MPTPGPLPALPVQRAGELPAAPLQTPWLVEDLWTDQAVGILGGEPKCCKSFLALDLALAVASATPCLRRFPVRHAGPVLLFPAEDSLAIVRQRLDGIAAAAQVALADLPLYVITALALRLDLPGDQQRLTRTVQALQPVLLVLDPLIRLHQRDENDASQIAPLLGFLRQLQRQFHLAVVLVHHAKKDGAALRPGQALRGSSELHGWGDSNLYLRRQRDQLTLTVEHRAAPSLDPIPIQLTRSDGALALALGHQPDPPPPQPLSPRQRVLDVLAAANRSLSLHEVRQRSGLRTATVCDVLHELIAASQARHAADGYRGPPPSPGLRLSPPLPPPTPNDQFVSPLSQLPLPIGPAGNGNGKRPLCSSGG